MSSIQAIYQSLKSGTASGRGVSYWDNDNDARCGKRLALAMAHKDVVKAAEKNAEEKATGTYLHGLLDMRHKGGLDDNLVLDLGPVQDIEWAEAIRLFAFIREHFPVSYFGETLASEVKLPVSDTHREKVRGFFGHDEATGAIDLLARFSAADCARWEADWGIRLSGPGLYSIDWKSSGARKSAEAAKENYTETLQAMMYPTLWNLTGGEPILGTIYFVVVKHKALRRFDVDAKNLSSVQVFYAPYRPEHALIVKNALNRARRERDAAEANAFACYHGGRACPFLGTLCGRI